jgi:hypothetical protein
MLFQTVIRAVVVSAESRAVQTLKSEVVKVGHKQGLAMLPQAFTSADIVKLYRERSFPAGKFSALVSKEPLMVLSPTQLQAVLGL